jgi:DNA-directed RNA polymerase beta subunit
MLQELTLRPIAELVINQLSPKNLGSSNDLQPFPGNNSGPREQMFASHQGQCMVIRGAEERYLQAGTEYEYATTTFNVSMPFTGTVNQVIPKLSPVAGGYQFRYNPLKIGVIESEDDPGLVGMVKIERLHTSHQTFGFMYSENRKCMDNFRAGHGFMKGDVFMQSPSVRPNGALAYGTNLNAMFASLNAVDNDGVVLSTAAIPKLTSTGIISTEGSWGRKVYPLNLYGTKDHYQPFPNVGQKIRPDGLLFALRTYDDATAVTEMTPEALMEVDYIWDKCVYGKAGGEVVDVTIHHAVSKNEPTPVGMDEQTRMYLHHQQTFYERIRRTYYDLKKKYGDRLRLAPNFHNLIVRALAEEENQPGFIIKTLNKIPLDDWHVNLTYTYDVVPDVGSKVTDCHGGKGVVVEIRDEADMPIDDYGRRAEIIMDPDSTINRMNIGRMYEQGTNWYSAMVLREIRLMREADPKGYVQQAWDLLMRYYQAASVRHFELFDDFVTEMDRRQHLEYILKSQDGIHIWMPSDRIDAGAPAYHRLMREFSHFEKTPVTYVNRVGRTIRTKAPMMIGSMYIIVLEKNGDDWSAVSSPKLQHYGIPAMVNGDNKYSTPGREQPVKFTGESETRLLNAVMGGEATADIVDMPNMPAGQKLIVKKILSVDNPSAIPEVLDKSLVPPGSNRALQIIKHLLLCGGITLSKER